MMYFYGVGVTRDVNEAKTLLNKSAAQGVEQAAAALKSL